MLHPFQTSDSGESLIWKQQSRLSVTSLQPFLAKGVGVMQSATSLQEAVNIVGSQSHLPRARSDQVVEEDVIVVNFEPQRVALLGHEPGELLRPPGIGVVVANRSAAQGGCTTENLNIAIGGPYKAGGKVGRTQVEQPQLGLSHGQTECNQQERKTRGHGSSGHCEEAEPEI